MSSNQGGRLQIDGRSSLQRKMKLPGSRQVRVLVRRAIEQLLQEDGDLLIRDASERAIAARLAHYLEALFSGFHVNVEYNRHALDRKRLDLSLECGGARRLVYPDIVVHRRGDDKSNLLAVELKKTTNPEPRGCDYAKLAAMRTQLGYRNCVFVEFPAGLGAKDRAPVQEWL